MQEHAGYSSSNRRLCLESVLRRRRRAVKRSQKPAQPVPLVIFTLSLDGIEFLFVFKISQVAAYLAPGVCSRIIVMCNAVLQSF